MARAITGFLLALALRLFPAPLRRRIGAELADAVHARLAGARHPIERAGILLAELAGIVSAALRARFPDEWTRRTAPIPDTWQDKHHADVPPFRSRFSPRRQLVSQLLSDVRFALRTFSRRRLMSGVAVASIALGIGASSSMFSVVDRVLLRPLPFERPNELVSIYPTWPSLR